MEHINETTRLNGVVTVTQANIGVLGSFLGFCILNKVVQPFIPSNVVSKGKYAEWKWRSMLLSWIHASIVGTWNLSSFYFYPELLSDLILHITPYTYNLLLFSLGYFIYDFVDLIIQRKVLTMWELSLHHISVVSTFAYNAFTQRYVAYTCVALLTEVNSIFLHLRKLLQMTECPFNHPFYRLNKYVNLVTFIIFRGFALYRVTMGIYWEQHRIESEYLVVLTFSMLIMDIINPIFFVMLLKNDFMSTKKRTTRASSSDKIKSKPMVDMNGNGISEHQENGSISDKYA